MAVWNPLSWGRRKKLTLNDPAGWNGEGPTRSAVAVNGQTAFSVAAFLCGARVISEGIAQLPLKLFEETDEEGTGETIRKPARDHPLYDKIAYQPSWLTSFEWREVGTLHAATAGNHYGWINRAPDGRVREILPLAADEVQFEINDTWEPVYQWKGKTIPRNQIFHLRGPTIDGRLGLDLIKTAREAIGLAKALENSHADLFGKGGRPAGVLASEEKITPEVADRIRATWMKRFGPGGDGGVAVIDGAWDYKSIMMSAVDAQFIETRKFQIEEIGRALRVFPQMLMHSDKTSTFASASEFFRAHVIHTLGPWIERWEGALKRDVIGYEGDNRNIWPRFVTDGLLRGDPEERGKFYQTMVQIGVLSPNDVRRLENLNPREGGDEYLTPLNMRIGDEPPEKETGDGA